ncbi:hypothetical protein FIU87_05420 [Bacillus sp. THAF10]|uniref:hypothetical protein n=1 Tax=Bacillus sp. THAF10 TaxID=2587848 RepID=UPI001268BC46|nr:hypothetical protein [Bacillus sp. THAF10]QFT88073.1 hypothetical protein FIU87_05420 [Bacillus sp. THAF10]
MREIQEAKDNILDSIQLQIKEMLLAGKGNQESWLEVLNHELLETFAYVELVRGSHQIPNNGQYGEYVRGVLGFVKEKKYEILHERKHFV